MKLYPYIGISIYVCMHTCTYLYLYLYLPQPYLSIYVALIEKVSQREATRLVVPLTAGTPALN